MKSCQSKWIAFIVSLFFMGTLCAEQKQFCDTYDTKTTNMSMVDGDNATYKGMPKRLTGHEYKTLPKARNPYCPECTLNDKRACEQRPCQQYYLMPGTIYQGIQAEGDPWMKMANGEALKSVQNGGGPFGAVIVQIDEESGKVLRYWVNHNHVVEWMDPTAHAEVTTIRTATRELGVLDLGRIKKSESKLAQPGEWSYCVMYSSAESCPMCMSAIYWANIKSLAFSATRFDAAVNGVNFSDEMIYEDFARPYVDRKHMHVVHSNTDNGLDAFNYYKRNNVARYGGAQP